MDFPNFVAGAYTARSFVADAQRCWNLYLAKTPTGRSPAVFYGTPGLRLLSTIGSGPIRGVYSVPNGLLVVSGGTLYNVSSSFVATSMLTLGTSAGLVQFAEAGQRVLIVDGSFGYGVNTDTMTALRITDGDFPAAPTTCCALGGYFVVNNGGTQQWYISSPFDVMTWNGLDFASKEGAADVLVQVSANYRELYLFGVETTEIWANTGNASFPFERVQGAFIQYGVVSPNVAKTLDGAHYFVSQSQEGFGIVWQLAGYQPARISTEAIESELSTYATLSDAYAWTYQQDGHAFYVVSFPTAQKTWCYDTSTGLWHERPYRASDSTMQHHRANSHTVFNGLHVVGDRINGNIYALDQNTFTDNGDVIVAKRSSPHVFSQNKLGTIGCIEVFFEPGVGNTGQGLDPQACMRISRDGGKTFGVERWTDIGRQGNYKTRARWMRCGSARDFVFELTITDPVKRVITGADITPQFSQA
jgi:hypothetical protein